MASPPTFTAGTWTKATGDGGGADRELAGLGRPSEKAPIDAISDAQAAKRLNVSERSVERAKAVQREAVPEVVKLVEDGKLAVSAAVAAR